MQLALMQPYFFPYLGYFQLVNAVDVFVVYDDVQYMKGGWINRNRILLDGAPAWISLPVMPSESTHNICEKTISGREYDKHRTKILGQLHAAYRKVPFYKETLPIIESILSFENLSLSAFIFNSLQKICRYLGIDTPLVLSSTLNKNDENMSGADRVIAICESQDASTYVNAIGGRELYRAEDFAAKNIDLRFIEMHPITYAQGGAEFVPYLSIIDVLMFNERSVVQQMLQQYSLQS